MPPLLKGGAAAAAERFNFIGIFSCVPSDSPILLFKVLSDPPVHRRRLFCVAA